MDGLQGLSAEDAQKLKDSLQIRTIKDLATNEFFQNALAINQAALKIQPRNDAKVEKSTKYSSDAEAHYSNLLDYFKNLVWIASAFLGVLVAVSIYFTYNNISELKSEAKTSMGDVKKDAKDAIDDTKNEAKTAIDYSRNAANLQISNIREQAAGIALGEAQKRVDDAFRSTNVQTLVEDAAQRQVGPVIERRVKGEVDRISATLQEDITSLGQIADAGSYMRNGGRRGLEQLLNLQKNGSTNRIRARAREMFVAIASDYDRVYTNRFKEAGITNILHTQYSAEQIRNKGKAGIITELVTTIKTSDSLEYVAEAFLMLREITAYPFRMFDIDMVNTWCIKHASECRVK